MYVAVKGGERAIDNAHRLLAQTRRGDPAVPELTLEQISEQLALACDRVMAEGSLYDRELAALAIKQARAYLLLQCPDLNAQRRLCNVQPLGGAREAQLLRHGQKITQAANLHDICIVSKPIGILYWRI